MNILGLSAFFHDSAAALVRDAEIERLGETLMKLELKMEELKKHFNLTDRDLNINLGPLGDLM